MIDHSPELEAECRERWPAVRVLANREQQGLSGARNTGLAESSGEVVAFLDDDAVAAPDWIERLGAAYADPRRARRGRHRTAVCGARAGRAGSPPSSTGSSAARTPGCRPSSSRSATWSAPTCPSARGSGRGRRLSPRAGADRHDPRRLRGDRPLHRIGKRRPEGRILYDPAAVGRTLRPTGARQDCILLSRCRGEGRSKAILVGAGRQRLRALRRALLRAAHAAARVSAGPGAAFAAISAASSGRRCWSSAC